MKINGLSKALTTAALGLSLTAAVSTAPSAAPLPVVAANVVAEAPSTTIDQVHWRGRGYYGYGRGYYGAGPFFAGAAFGGLLGAATFGGGYGYGYGYPYYGGGYYPAYSYGYGYPYYGYARPFYRPRYRYVRRFYGPRYGYYHRPGFYRAAYWGPRYHHHRHFRHW